MVRFLLRLAPAMNDSLQAAFGETYSIYAAKISACTISESSKSCGPNLSAT